VSSASAFLIARGYPGKARIYETPAFFQNFCVNGEVDNRSPCQSDAFLFRGRRPRTPTYFSSAAKKRRACSAALALGSRAARELARQGRVKINGLGQHELLILLPRGSADSGGDNSNGKYRFIFLVV